MGPIISIDPFKCRVWPLHDRLDDHISEETCRAEIRSFAEHGQLVPVLGRPLQGDPVHEIELIYGARRLFIARTLNCPLLVELREISDRDAIVAMDTENRHRKDVSPYERGLCYTRWLRTALFQTQEDIAQALNVSASQVSRLLKVARLPSVVVNAFGSAVSICEGWGLDLAEALENPEKRQRTIQVARTIAAISPRPPAKEVYRQLLAASVQGRKPRRTARDQIVKGSDGRTLFRVQHRQDAIAMLLPIDKISASALQLIQEKIVDVLEAIDRDSDKASAVERSLSSVLDRVRDKSSAASNVGFQ